MKKLCDENRFVATHKWKFPALADSVVQMFNLW